MSSAEQWIVPCLRMPKNLRTARVELVVGRRRSSRSSLPLVSFQWSQILRASSVSRFDLGEAVRPGELQGPLADEQAVVGPLHHQPGDGRGVHDVPERGDGAAAVGRAVHDGGVELDDALLVGDAAVADGVVGRVGLDDRDALDRRVERVGAGLDQLHRLLDGLQAVGAGDDHGPPRPDRPRAARPRAAAAPRPAAAAADRNARRFTLSDIGSIPRRVGIAARSVRAGAGSRRVGPIGTTRPPIRRGERRSRVGRELGLADPAIVRLSMPPSPAIAGVRSARRRAARSPRDADRTQRPMAARAERSWKTRYRLGRAWPGSRPWPLVAASRSPVAGCSSFHRDDGGELPAEDPRRAPTRTSATSPTASSPRRSCYDDDAAEGRGGPRSWSRSSRRARSRSRPGP